MQRQAQPRDDVLLQMQDAFARGNKARLAQLLPLAQGHALEPWAAYWELRARLDTAPAQEILQFLARYEEHTRRTACATTGCSCWGAANGTHSRRSTPSTA